MYSSALCESENTVAPAWVLTGMNVYFMRERTILVLVYSVIVMK